MPSEAQQPLWQPTNWSTNLCPGANAHNTLWPIASLIQKHLDGSEVNRENAEKMEKSLGPLSLHLDGVDCDKLHAYAIQVLRGSAFINMPQDTYFVLQCHHMIKHLWDTRRRRKKSRRVFRVDDFLETWIRDLPYVRDEAIHNYVDLLDCDGLSKSARLNIAMERLQDHILEKVLPTDATVADGAGNALFEHVLQPLRDKSKKRLAECLALASKIADRCAVAGRFESVKRLSSLVDELGKLTFENAKEMPQRHQLLAAAYGDIRSMLSETRRSACNEPFFMEFSQHVDPVIQKVASWSRASTKLKAPPACHIILRTLFGKTAYECKGTIKDLTRDGQFYHVCFDDLEDCFGVKGTKRLIRKRPRPDLRRIKLCVTNKQKQRWEIAQAQAEILLPGKASGESPDVRQSRALPIRGWRYKYKNQGKAAAVVWLENPPAIQDFPEMAEMLPHESEAEHEDVKSLSDIAEPEPKLALKGQFVSSAPFPQGSEQLLEEIVEWFRDLSEKILQDRRWEGFWSKGEPIQERGIDAQIRQPLREYVESQGGHLGSQEETGLGPCDYLVSHGPDKVVVELKSSENKKWKQGIDAQLASYMSKAGTRYGLFVVVAFKKAFQRDSNELHDLLKRREIVSENEQIRIDIVVISCDKPEPAAQRKKPPSPGEGFQYYKGPSPAPEAVQ